MKESILILFIIIFMTYIINGCFKNDIFIKILFIIYFIIFSLYGCTIILYLIERGKLC